MATAQGRVLRLVTWALLTSGHAAAVHRPEEAESYDNVAIVGRAMAADMIVGSEERLAVELSAGAGTSFVEGATIKDCITTSGLHRLIGFTWRLLESSLSRSKFRGTSALLQQTPPTFAGPNYAGANTDLWYPKQLHSQVEYYLLGFLLGSVGMTFLLGAFCLWVCSIRLKLFAGSSGHLAALSMLKVPIERIWWATHGEAHMFLSFRESCACF